MFAWPDADAEVNRFAIEIPWGRFAKEFVAPARELKFLARHLRTFDVPALLAPPSAESTARPTEAPTSREPLRLSESERAELNARLQWAFQAWTKATGVEVAAQSLDSTSLRNLALSTQALLACAVSSLPATASIAQQYEWNNVSGGS